MIEILIGVALIALFCLLFTYYQWHIISWQKEGVQYLQAVSCASSHVEKALAKGAVPTTTANNEFTCNDTIHIVEPSSSIQDVFKPSRNKNRFMLLETTVSWNSTRGKTRSIAIVGGVISQHEI